MFLCVRHLQLSSLHGAEEEAQLSHLATHGEQARLRVFAVSVRAPESFELFVPVCICLCVFMQDTRTRLSSSMALIFICVCIEQNRLAGVMMSM